MSKTGKVFAISFEMASNSETNLKVAVISTKKQKVHVFAL